MKLFRTIVTVVVIFFTITGCGTITGIPGHGGGKRFAVEQELVAGTIRAAAKALDVSAIQGKRIALYIVAMRDQGNGNLLGGRLALSTLLRGESIQNPVIQESSTFPIIETQSTTRVLSDTQSSNATTTSESDSATTISGVTTTTTTAANSSSSNSTTNDSAAQQSTTTNQVVVNSPESKTTQTRGHGEVAQIGAGYNGIGSYQNSTVISPQDTQFLSAVIQNYFFLKGVTVTSPNQADIDVYITVDVFGTIRARTDWFVTNREILKAKTALEMVAIDRATGEVVIAPQVASYEAMYNERYAFWVGPTKVEKTLYESDGLLTDYTDVLEK